MPEPAPLTVDETKLFKAIETGDSAEAIRLLDAGVSVHCHDSDGMSPLSQAAYKGNMEVTSACLRHGADVNEKKHKHGYTALMFAALAGKPELCCVLLDAGAHSYPTNSIGKSACEMAAFVGQHECVSIINNHVGPSQIDAFLHPKGSESEERFPDHLIHFIHSLASTHQIHPVSLIFKIIAYEHAMEYRKKVGYVLDRIFEKQLRCKQGNEVMSLKLWLVLFVWRECGKAWDARPEKTANESLTLLARSLVQMVDGQQNRPALEAMLRTAVHAFPYKQSLLHETLSKALSKSCPSTRPSAYDYVVQALFGQRILAVSHFCAVCGVPNAAKRCPKCKLSYCSQLCQKFDWPVHKTFCNKFREWAEEAEYEHAPEEGGISLDQLQLNMKEEEGEEGAVEKGVKIDEISSDPVVEGSSTA